MTTQTGAKHTPELWVDDRGDGDERYSALFTEVIGKDAEICDTLNASHLITREEGRDWLDKLCERYNAYPTLIASVEALKAALGAWLAQYDGFDQVQLEKRCDPATLDRIAETRRVLSSLPTAQVKT